jgi:SAM-dependent methyltransferase
MFIHIKKYLTRLLYPLAKRIVKKREGTWHHRKMAAVILEGTGIEIGALHNPQKISNNATVEYVDIITKEDALKKYPELDPMSIVEVKYVFDIDKAGLVGIEDESKDFAIICHIIEHTANLIYIIEELLRVLKRGGHLVNACPDKHFSFDSPRLLTTWENLLTDYENKINYVEDFHLLENVNFFSKNYISEAEEMNVYKNGKAHVHVWDSDSFALFLEKTCLLINVNAVCLYKSTGQENKHEYFTF